jgi:hypothetical protein
MWSCYAFGGADERTAQQRQLWQRHYLVCDIRRLCNSVLTSTTHPKGPEGRIG